MKEKIYTLLILGLIITNQILAQQWWNVGPAGFSADEADYTSLAIDGSGTPYVAFKDIGKENKATVMKFDGTNWVTVGLAGFSAGDANYISLAIDGSNTPYVAFLDNVSKVTVMKLNGSSWENVGLPGLNAGYAIRISLAIDGSNNPYVAYSDFIDESSKATVKKFDGSSWVNVGSPGFNAGDANYISLAIDGSNTPYVAYLDYDGSYYRNTVMKFDGSSWVNVGSPDYLSSTIQDISLAIYGSSTPYVAFRDNETSSKGGATVMKFDGSSWVNVGPAGFSAGEVLSTSLVLDGSGTPYVAFMDAGKENKATVMKFDGSSWVNVGSAGFSAGMADYTSLALAPNGIPVVAFSDILNGSKATVMKFSANEGDLLPVELTSFSAKEEKGKVVLNWSTATEVNNYGFEVERSLVTGHQSLGNWEKIGFVNGNGNSSSQKEYSFVDDNSIAGNLQYRLKQIDTDGGYKYYSQIAKVNFSVTGVTENQIPEEYALMQNYPNPFNPATVIKYQIPEESHVTLKVYNIIGQTAATLVDKTQTAGRYNVEFNGENLSAGIYFYKLSTDNFTSVKKMILTK
jgi:hypothetical protein